MKNGIAGGSEHHEGLDTEATAPAETQHPKYLNW